MSSLFRWATVGSLSAGALLVGATSASAAPKTSNAQATTLLTNALKVTNAAKSLTVSGHGGTKGQTVKINISAGGNDAFGTLSYSGQSTILRRVGSVIFTNSSKGFLEKQGASASEATVEAKKWFKVLSENSSYASLNQFLSVSSLLSGVIPKDATGKISGVKTSTVDGQPVEVITGTFQGQKGSFYVDTHGTPYVVRVSYPPSVSGSGITLDLSHFNKPVHTTVPKGAVTQ
jgi:hypothetical protein